jgi:hypothetical protein
MAEQRGKLGRTRKYRRLGTESEYNTHKKYRTARVKAKELKEQKERTAPLPTFSTDNIVSPETPAVPVWGRPVGALADHNVTLEDEQQQMFNSYLEHLARGKSARSFTFRGKHLTGMYQAAESLPKNFPERFKKVDIEIAKTLGFSKWEQVVADSAVGDNTRANTATLQMLMRNRYDWDRQGALNTDALEAEINRLTTFFVSIGLAKENKADGITHKDPGVTLEHPSHVPEAIARNES